VEHGGVELIRVMQMDDRGFKEGALHQAYAAAGYEDYMYANEPNSPGPDRAQRPSAVAATQSRAFYNQKGTPKLALEAA
jgi:hypothetical protein